MCTHRKFLFLVALSMNKRTPANGRLHRRADAVVEGREEGYSARARCGASPAMAWLLITVNRSTNSACTFLDLCQLTEDPTVFHPSLLHLHAPSHLFTSLFFFLFSAEDDFLFLMTPTAHVSPNSPKTAQLPLSVSVHWGKTKNKELRVFVSGKKKNCVIWPGGPIRSRIDTVVPSGAA